MGFFDSLRQASAESAGRVMKMQLDEAEQGFDAMTPAVRRQVLQDFCQRREAIMSRLSKMTRDGVMKIGIDFQVAGNKLKKSAPAEGYPLLMTGMWLESRHRPGPDAVFVHTFLEQLATRLGGTSDRY